MPTQDSTYRHYIIIGIVVGLLVILGTAVNAGIFIGKYATIEYVDKKDQAIIDQKNNEINEMKAKIDWVYKYLLGEANKKAEKAEKEKK